MSGPTVNPPANLTQSSGTGPTDAEWAEFQTELKRELEDESVPRLTTQQGSHAITRTGVIFMLDGPVTRADRVSINGGPLINVKVDLVHSDIDGKTPTTIYTPDGEGPRIVIKWTSTIPFTESGGLAGKLDLTFAVIKDVGHLVFDHTKVMWSGPLSVYVCLAADGDTTTTENPGASEARLSFIVDSDNGALIFAGLSVTPRESTDLVTRMTEKMAHGMIHDMRSGMTPAGRAEFDANLDQIHKSMEDDVAFVMSRCTSSPPNTTTESTRSHTDSESPAPSANAGLVFTDDATPAMLGIADLNATTTPPMLDGQPNAHPLGSASSMSGVTTVEME